MRIESAARSHVGHVRAINEDAWGVWPESVSAESEIFAGLFAVADGMGGHPGGEIASGIAVRTALDLAAVTAADPALRLRSLFQEAAHRIRIHGQEDPAYREMGTTLTVAAIQEGLAWIGHIGDSRLYWIRGDRQVQVTRDHTVAQNMIEQGILNPEAAERHPASHILTRCLGVCPEQNPDHLAEPMALAAGDLVLLTTDGLVKAVAPARIAALVAAPTVEQAATRLVDAALEEGGPDNVTVLLIAIRETKPHRPGLPAVGFDEVFRLSWRRR